MVIRILHIAWCCVLLLSSCTTRPATRAPELDTHVVQSIDHVDLVVLPDDSSDQLIAKISSARQRVLVTIYLLSDSRVFDALAVARQKGTLVRVLVEHNPVNGSTNAQETMNHLQKDGIEARYASTYFRLTHAKYLVIDDEVFIMTANLTNSGLKENREILVSTRDEAIVSEVVDVFDADWSKDPKPFVSDILVWSPVNSRSLIDAVIDASHSSLIVYAEEVQDDDQVARLTRAASRGVQVRLLTSPPAILTDTEPNHRGLDQLQRGGVNVRYLKKPYIHAKMMLIDSTIAFVGSQNISTYSLEFNRELGVLVSDSLAITRLEETFSGDWTRAVDR